ncbi:unnamed protein product [Peniophora sp. CBMAI 1063]|nr:unnamed protein product [Peniophora sp. CBMAI 1063]
MSSRSIRHPTPGPERPDDFAGIGDTADAPIRVADSSDSSAAGSVYDEFADPSLDLMFDTRCSFSDDSEDDDVDMANGDAADVSAGSARAQLVRHSPVSLPAPAPVPVPAPAPIPPVPASGVQTPASPPPRYIGSTTAAVVAEATTLPLPPRGPRRPYTLQIRDLSPLPAADLEVPDLFRQAGISTSEQYESWLDLQVESSVASPPHMRELNGFEAATLIGIEADLRRQVQNYRAARSQLRAFSGLIREADNLEQLLYGLAANPIIRAASAAQGVDVLLPEFVTNRGTRPTHGSSSNSPEPSQPTTAHTAPVTVTVHSGRASSSTELPEPSEVAGTSEPAHGTSANASTSRAPRPHEAPFVNARGAVCFEQRPLTSLYVEELLDRSQPGPSIRHLPAPPPVVAARNRSEARRRGGGVTEVARQQRRPAKDKRTVAGHLPVPQPNVGAGYNGASSSSASSSAPRGRTKRREPTIELTDSDEDVVDLRRPPIPKKRRRLGG